MAARMAYAEQGNYYGTAAPKVQPIPQATPRPKVVRKSRAAQKRDARRARAQAIKLMAIATVLFLVLGFQIYSHVRVEELNRQIETTNSSISVMQSENTRLKMDLNASASLDKVEDYAVNELGMVS